jgi:tetratricopeptide (TPR) repeat protein
VGDAFEILKAHYFLTLTLVNLGRIAEALEVLGRAVEMARRNGERFWASRVPNCFGWIHRELQDFEGALPFDREGAETANRLGVVEAEINSVLNLALDYGDAGAKQQMDAVMRSAEEIVAKEAWFRWRFEIRLQAARAERILSRHEALGLIEIAGRYKARKYVVAGHTLLAKVAITEGDLETAEAQLKTAVGILQEFPAPLAAWKTYSLLGQVSARLGRASDAAAAFGTALSIVNDIAGRIGDERLCAIFLGSAAVSGVRSRSAASHAPDASHA